jgi:chromosome segregation ATPase
MDAKDKIKQFFKKIIPYIVAFFGGVIAFALGRNINRSRVSADKRSIDELGNTIDRAADRDKKLESANTELDNNTADLSDVRNKLQQSSDNIARNNDSAIKSVRTAKDILRDAAARNKS